MQLTGKQIVDNNIIYGVCDKSIQQQGVDVRVKDIRKVVDILPGYIPIDGKTIIPKTEELKLIDKCWELTPGYYEVTFMEGCKIPSNCAMYFKTRSSLVRCGSDVRSGQFDGGFETEEMGAFLKVELPIIIEYGARIAQAIVSETYEVSDEYLYDGQWQNDKQRKG